MSWTMSYGACGADDGENVIVLLAAGVGLEVGYSDAFKLGKLVGGFELFELGSEEGYDEGINNDGIEEGTEDGITLKSSLLIVTVDHMTCGDRLNVVKSRQSEVTLSTSCAELMICKCYFSFLEELKVLGQNASS